MNVGFIQDFTVVLLVAGLSGALCRRLGASVTIGYLIAGIIVGPYTPPMNLVLDVDGIRTLSQLGLIFLMFSTGMRLSFRKIRQLGAGFFVAVLCSALTIVIVLRVGGGLAHITPLTALFIAGMLVSSSSAIISRILHEGGLIHRHSGQLAMTFTLLEDLAAITLFSMVGGYAMVEKIPFLRETGAFLAFLVLAGILALLFVPRFLSVIQHRLQHELQTLLVAGLLCLLAVLAARAGYSPALGAFLFGLIISGTPQRSWIERTFTGLRDIFTAVFFVSIGMLIDARTLMSPWLLLVLPLMAAGAIAIRIVSVSIGLLLAGYNVRIVVPTALTLTVTGEFSFIFAQLGVERGLLPEHTQALVVGVCVLTAAFASFAAPRGEHLAALLLARRPKFLETVAAGWQNLIEGFWRGRKGGTFWKFARKRLLQIAVELLLVMGLLIFAEPLYARVLGMDMFHTRALPGIAAIMTFWTLFGSLLLVPLIAIWRNIGVLALFCAEAAQESHSSSDYRSILIENLVKLIAAVFLAGWLWLWWPFHVAPHWVPLGLVVVLAAMGILFWRKLAFWHSVLEGRVYQALHADEAARLKVWREKTSEWNLQMAQHVVADNSPYAGRSIADLALRTKFHCTIIAIERQGFMITNPTAAHVIYPGDELLLLGETENLERASEWLSASEPIVAEEDVHVEDIHFETITVPDNSPRIGKTLMELEIPSVTGVQIAGLRRAGIERTNLPATETLEAADEILAIGFARQLSAFKDWLSGD